MGFLSGKKTYILGGLMFLHGLVSWLGGDITVTEFFNMVPEMLAGLGFMALRAGVHNG